MIKRKKKPEFSFTKLFIYEIYNTINPMFKNKSKFLREKLDKEDLEKLYKVSKDFIEEYEGEDEK
jgi:hypothetical protein